MALFYTEGNRQVVIFLLGSANYDNVNAVSKSGQITNFSRVVSQELINLFHHYLMVLFCIGTAYYLYSFII